MPGPGKFFRSRISHGDLSSMVTMTGARMDGDLSSKFNCKKRWRSASEEPVGTTAWAVGMQSEHCTRRASNFRNTNSPAMQRADIMLKLKLKSLFPEIYSGGPPDKKLPYGNLTGSGALKQNKHSNLAEKWDTLKSLVIQHIEFLLPTRHALQYQ